VQDAHLVPNGSSSVHNHAAEPSLVRELEGLLMDLHMLRRAGQASTELSSASGTAYAHSMCTWEHQTEACAVQ